MKTRTFFIGITALLFSLVSNAQPGWSVANNNSGAEATALGLETTATGNQSTALGFRSTASGLQSFSAGHWSLADGRYAFALGARAYARDDHAMAFGIDVRANANRSITIGTGVGNGSANALHNDIRNSLMVGFNSTIPTLFVGSSNGANTIGRVGIGTTAPGGVLEVRNNTNPNMILSNAANNRLEFGVSNCNGCYNGFSTSGDAVARVLGGGDLIFSIPGTNGSRKIAFHTEGDRVLTIQEVGTTGKVGVGTINFPTTVGGANISNYKLFVKGGMLTEEVLVRTGWADYVFADDYELKTIPELEAFINENKHLPNVPSAAQVEAEGIELGDIARIQQEKIEELTLYIIQLEKKFEIQQAQLSELSRKVNGTPKKKD